MGMWLPLGYRARYGILHQWVKTVAIEQAKGNGMSDQDDQNGKHEPSRKHGQKDPTKSTTNGGPVTRLPDEEPGGKHGKK